MQLAGKMLGLLWFLIIVRGSVLLKEKFLSVQGLH